MKSFANSIVIILIASIVLFAGCVEETETQGEETETQGVETETQGEETETQGEETETQGEETETQGEETETQGEETKTVWPDIIITAPKNGNEVSWREIIEGTSEGVYDTELKIYVLIYPTDVGGPWWVQPDVDVFHDGSWETNSYFGRDPMIHPEDKGANFRVCAIITTDKLREDEQWQKLPDYVVKNEVKVIRG